jgi:hypothetical protein
MASGMIFASQVNGRGFDPHYVQFLDLISSSHVLGPTGCCLFFLGLFCHRLCFKCQQGNVAIYLRHSQAFHKRSVFLSTSRPRKGGIRAPGCKWT